MSFNYERRHQRLASPAVFRSRVLHHGALALWMVVPSIVVGMLGYHLLGRQSWIDSFLNACMLLGGMGPVGDLATNAGKVFAALYALYAGLLFIAVSGLVLAPFLHRLVHAFHLEDR